MKSKNVTFALCLLFGWLGIHRIYVGKWITGLIQMFTFGGFIIWWTIDFFTILVGKFRDASGALLGQSVQQINSCSQQKQNEFIQSTSSEIPQDDWIMKAKPTPYWKFLLGANLFKVYQLDFVEKKGSCITVAVQSGKRCSFRIGEFSGKYIKTKEGIRDFIFKSTAGPTQKVTFRETLLQMPEEWWDELESKLGASESGLSKVLHSAKNILGDFS